MMINHSLLLMAPGEVRWVEAALPSLGRNDLLIETVAGAISLGTELPHYRGDSRNSGPPSYPSMTGYESLGVVRARGADVSGVELGDRVVASYGHRTSAVVDADRAIVVPPEIGDELALLTILSGDVAQGVSRLGPTLPSSVLVTGAGAIGLLTLFVLRNLGVASVDVVEPDASRWDLARRFGATQAVAPDDSHALRGDYATGLECSGRDAAFALLQARIRPRGQICVLSDGNLEPLTLAPWFHERELTVTGSSDCPDYQAHARWWFPTVRRAGRDLAALFDLRIATGELAATFARLAAGDASVIKVLVQYD